MDGGEDVGEPDGSNTPEHDIEGHVDLRVLAVELLRRDVDAAAGGHDHVHGLVDRVDALEDVVGAAVPVAVGRGDAQDVDAVDEAVYNAVLALDADQELTAGGGEGVVAEGGVEVVGGRGRGG